MCMVHAIQMHIALTINSTTKTKKNNPTEQKNVPTEKPTHSDIDGTMHGRCWFCWTYMIVFKIYISFRPHLCFVFIHCIFAFKPINHQRSPFMNRRVLFFPVWLVIGIGFCLFYLVNHFESMELLYTENVIQAIRQHENKCESNEYNREQISDKLFFTPLKW